ncbi:MAG: ATP-binding protein [bacterium]
MAVNDSVAKKLEEMRGQRFGIRILNSMGMAVVVLDANFNITWANTAYRKLQEKPEDKIIGKKCYEVSFAHHEPCSEKACAVRRTLRTKENSKGLKILKKGREEKYLDVYSFPLFAPQGELSYVVEVIQDNTQLYKLVELSEKLTAFASHELKTPLATIHQLATILRQIDLSPGKRQDLFDRIISRSQHGLKTVGNFLVYSKIKAGELQIVPKRVNFYYEVVNRVLDFQRGYTQKKETGFRCDIPKDLEVICDPDYVEIIYNNLITNAIKYRPENKEIFLGYRDRKDEYHYFNVANVGEVIAEEDRETIFKKFITTRKDGTGIGLDVARELVKKHGGRIWVESCYFISGKYLFEDQVREGEKERSEKGNNFVFTIHKNLKEV